MSSVGYEAGGRLARITLNRPQVRNAVNRELLAGLNRSLANALADEGVDLIHLTGAGQDFCAGEDLTELAGGLPSEAEAAETIDRFQEITRQIMFGGKVVICTVQGWAIGAGGAWPLNADFTLWSETARLRFPESRHGLFVSGGVSALLATHCGPVAARQALWLGETIAGERLVQLGLASGLVPEAELAEAGERLVERLLALPPQSLIRYKQAQSVLTMAETERALQVEAEQMADAVRHFREHDPRLRFQPED